MTVYIEPAPINVQNADQASIDGTQDSLVAKNKRPLGNNLISLLVISILLVLARGLVQATAERPDGTAPDYEMQFFNGYEWENQPIANLSEFEGKVVVLNFWASWCVECLLEAELLEQKWQEYADQDVVFLGVAYVDVEPKSIAYLEQFNITYPNAPDLRSTISSEYEITGVPETFFINKEGEITHIQIGPVNDTMLTTLIEQMLAEG
jgi:cytochrome c biogenesis protein CcmG/thiol:disulfide interchange protein DsbE